MDPATRQHLAAARLWAATRFPYLASAVFASPVIEAPGAGTVSVDDRWRLHVDAEVAASWSVEELGSVLVHHVGHLLRDHAERAQALGVGTDQAEDWVKAADAEINDDFERAGLQFPDEPVVPESFGCEPGRLAEEYFRVIRGRGRDDGDGHTDEDTDSDSGSGADSDTDPGSDTGTSGDTAADGDAAQGHAHDCGSGAHGIPSADDTGGDDGATPRPHGLDDHDQRRLRRQVAEEIRQAGRDAGSVPLGLRRWADDLLEPKVDWRRLLAAELRRGIADVTGAVDYSYRRPSRRSTVAGDVVLPSLRRPVPEVAVVCDTSASMSDDLLAGVLGEVEGLLGAVGVRGQAVRVLSCDVMAHTVQRVSNARQVSLLGGGGTDMGAGIAAAVACRPRPDMVVVLTDGFTPWPSAPPRGVRVVVGLLGRSAPAAPPWARTVHIDEPV